MPTENPDGTTTVPGVEVVGRRQTRFTVYPPSRATPSPPLGGENAEIPDSGSGGSEIEPSECEKEVTRDRAALVAADLLDGYPDNVEHGFYLVENEDGSVRAVGPVVGEIVDGVPRIDWSTSLSDLGINSWSRLVGLVHNHPRLNNTGGGYDGHRNEFSPEDVAVTNAFIAAGADPDVFRQYLRVGDATHEFDADAEAGDEGTTANQVTGVNNCE